VLGEAPRLSNSPSLVVRWAAERPAPRIVMTCDDDYWSPRPWTKFRPSFADALRHQEVALRCADEIVVPTVRLAERVQRFGRPVTVIPPTLAARSEWPAPRESRAPGLRIGYVATWWHWGELVALGPVMLEFLAQHPEVTFVLGGGPFDGSRTVAWAVGHPQVELHSGHVSLPGYYRFIASLDLDGFICPLLDLPFNTAKPSLKPLEAAMLGLPVIASRVGSYAEDLRHEETALLVENTTEAWLTALTRVVEDAALRAHLSARGLDWAATRTIDSTGPLWATVWGAAPPPDHVA
jgi:glycosyltransferase involved in cell wall biosynthesis